METKKSVKTNKNGHEPKEAGPYDDSNKGDAEHPNKIVQMDSEDRIRWWPYTQATIQWKLYLPPATFW